MKNYQKKTKKDPAVEIEQTVARTKKKHKINFSWVRDMFETVCDTRGHGLDNVGMPRLFWLVAIGVSLGINRLGSIQEQYISTNSIFDNIVSLTVIVVVALIMVLTFKKQLFKTAPNRFEIIRSQYRDDVRIMAVVVVVLAIYGALIEFIFGGTDTALPKTYTAWQSAVSAVEKVEMLRSQGYVIVAIFTVAIMALVFHKKLSKYSGMAFLFLLANIGSDLGNALLDLKTQATIKKDVYEQIVVALQKQHVTLIKYPTGAMYVNGLYMLLTAIVVIYACVLVYTFILGADYVQEEQKG